MRGRMSERDDLVEVITWTCRSVLETGERSLLVTADIGWILGLALRGAQNG